MSTLSEIKQIKAQIESLRKEAKSKVESIFKVATLELFTEYPNLESVSWTQYTPYFNDGDPCTFRSSHDSPSIVFTSSERIDDDDDDDDGYEEEFSEYTYYDGYGKDRKLKADLTKEQKAELKTGKAVIKFLENFDDDDMENLFGDGYKVILTKDGISVDDYNHD